MFYDPCTSVTIDAVQWKNPHLLIDLKTTDGAAYRAEWTSLQGLANGGVAGPSEMRSEVVQHVGP
jgi:hypothetical protein